MALTATTTLDIVGQTQTITFNNPSQVDQFVYSGGAIIHKASTTFNLAKSDVVLYFQFLNAFNNLLILNFPKVNASIGAIFPLCQFDISETNVGVKKVIYNQTSQGTTVINIDYLPIASSAAYATIGSDVTISLQEWFFQIIMMYQFNNQVSLN